MSSGKRPRLEICVHPLRVKFSSRCSKSQHGMCSGKVNKKRCEDEICKCPCHKEVDQ